MPSGLLDKAVDRIISRGVKKSSAYPIAVAALQKSGSLKQGTVKPTAKGVKRNQMSRKEREATR
jgi:hypothetical protein